MINSVRLLARAGAFALILAAYALPCRGQHSGDGGPPPRLDPILAYEFGRLLAIDRSAGSVNWCNQCSGDGTSYSHLFRFGASLHLPDVPFQGTVLNPRLSLNFSGGEFTSDPFNDPLVDPGNNEIVSVVRRFNVDALTAAVGLDVPVALDIGDGWTFGLGGWAEYRILSRFIHTEEIVEPDDATFFENGMRSRIVAEGDLLGSSPFTGGAIFTVSRPFSVSRSLAIAPELIARINGTAIALGLGSRSFSAGVGVAFRLTEPWRPERAAAPVPPGDPTPLPPPPPRPVLSAAVDLYCIDAGGAKKDEGWLVPRRTLIRRHTSPQGESVLLDYHAPRIGVTPEITAGAGVRWWGLSIRQGRTEIGRVTSEMPDKTLDLEVRIDEGHTPDPLTAELFVEDSAGAFAGARDVLAFAFDPATADTSLTGTYDVVEEWWVVREEDGDFNDAGTATRKSIAEIVATALEGRPVFLHPSREFDGSPTKLDGLVRLLEEQGVHPALSFKHSYDFPSSESTRGGVDVLIVVRAVREDRSAP